MWFAIMHEKIASLGKDRENDELHVKTHLVGPFRDKEQVFSHFDSHDREDTFFQILELSDPRIPESEWYTPLPMNLREIESLADSSPILLVREIATAILTNEVERLQPYWEKADEINQAISKVMNP